MFSYPTQITSFPLNRNAFFDRLKARLDAVPGVEVSTVTSNIPLSGSWNFSYEIDGQPQPDSRRRPNVDAIITSPDYFRVMGDPFIAGRDFTAADGTPSALNIIVNRQCAETFWHGENAIGKRLRLYKKDVAQPWLTVAGIVPDIASNYQSRPKRGPTIYLPYRQENDSSMIVAARTTVPPSTLKQMFRREVQALDDDLPVHNLRTMEEQLERQNWPYRVFGSLFAIFAAIALGLPPLAFTPSSPTRSTRGPRKSASASHSARGTGISYVWSFRKA